MSVFVSYMVTPIGGTPVAITAEGMKDAAEIFGDKFEYEGKVEVFLMPPVVVYEVKNEAVPFYTASRL